MSKPDTRKPKGIVVIGAERRAADRLKAAETRIKRLERDARAAAKVEQGLREIIAKDKEVAQAIRDAARDAALKPSRAPYVPLANSDKGRPVVSMCLGLNDIHDGAFVDPARTSGRLSYSVAEAEYGFGCLMRDVANHAKTMSSAYRIKELRVMALGDIINGELHGKDSVVENEIPPPVQVVHAGRMISGGLAALAPSFPEIRVEWVVGNHDRSDEKMGSNKSDERSWGYTVAEWVADMTRRLKNVEIVRHQDQLPTVEVNGFNIGLSHGHGIQMHKRMPFYGMRDFLIGRILEALDYHGPVPDMICLAHFHQRAVTDDGRVMVLPSMMGNSHWSRNAGFRGRPAQLTWFIGKHGPFGDIPWARQKPPEARP